MIIVPKADITPERLEHLRAALKDLGVIAHVAGCPERPLLLAPGTPAGSGLIRALRELGEVEQVVPGDEGGAPIELMARRTFLDYAIGAAAAGAAAFGLWATVAIARPPRRARHRDEETVVSRSRLQSADAVTFQLGHDLGILVRTGGQFYALSAICTHKWTCQVEWDGRRQQLLCPCHNGAFDLEGNVVAGPPPRPLQRWRVAVLGQNIHIRR